MVVRFRRSRLRAETTCDPLAQTVTCSNGVLSNPTAVQSCVPYDSAFSGVSLLMHLDNSVADVKGSATTLSGAKVSSTESKFGGYSTYASVGGNTIRLPSAATVSGSQDFTVEMWVKPTAYPASYGQLMTSTTTGGFATSITSTGRIWTGRALMAGVFETTGTVPLNQWSHLAYVRSGNNLKVFINGTQAGSFSITFGSWAAGDALLFVDGNGSSVPLLNTYMDELRITKGVARYTAPFTAPTAPFANE